MKDFARTLEVAADAAGIASLLNRVADGGWPITAMDITRLKALAERYVDYAAALRETAAGIDTAPADDQPLLFGGAAP